MYKQTKARSTRYGYIFVLIFDVAVIQYTLAYNHKSLFLVVCALLLTLFYTAVCTSRKTVDSVAAGLRFGLTHT